MWKWLRALSLLVTGRFRKAYQALMGNEYVVEATYDASIEKGKDRIVAMSEAIAALLRIKEEKIASVNVKSKDYQRLQDVKKGALAKAKDVANRLQQQGHSSEQIKSNADYVRCQAAFNSADADAKRLEQDIHGLEEDIKQRTQVIEAKKVALQQAKKQQDDLKTEKHEAVVDILTAKQEEQVNRQLAGLEQDTTDQDLAAARESRKQAQARSKIISELAGTDHSSSQNEFAAYAQQAAAHSEFDSLIGLDIDKQAEKTLDPAKLPEN